MEISPAARVGILTVIALILLVGVLFYINPQNSAIEGNKYYALFDSVAGLPVGADVRMAGVPIGRVRDITIDPDKKIRVAFVVSYIQSGQPLKLTKESSYTVNSDLVGNKWMEIVPHPGTEVTKEATVDGTTPVTMDELMAKGNEALGQLEGSVKEINKLVADPEFERNLKETVANFNALAAEMRNTAVSANGVMKNLNGRVSLITGHVDSLILGLQSQLHDIGTDFKSLSSTLREVGQQNAPDLRLIVTNLRDTAASAKSMMATMNQLVQNKQLSQDMLGTVAALRRTGEELEGVAGDVRSLTSDPQLQADLKGTIHDARETMSGANKIIKGLQHVMGGFGGGGEDGGVSGSNGFKLFGVQAETEYDTRTHIVAPNVNFTVLPNAKFHPIFGVDSIGNQDLVNMQLGANMTKGGALQARFGFIRSKAGVGFDARLFNRLGIQTQVYDPTDVKVDAVARFTIAKGFYLMGGVRDATHMNKTHYDHDHRPQRGSPMIGIGKQF
jgi:ABC-type transporter Mla subunit MlaD